MTSTNIGETAPAHNIKCATIAKEIFSTETADLQPRQREGAGDAGWMLFQQNGYRAGFVAPSIADIAPAESCLWGVEHLTDGAEEVARHLAGLACEYSGEAIERIEVLADAAGVPMERVFEIMDELEARGVIAHYACQNSARNLLICCRFDVDSDAYYGDDRTIECDAPSPADDYFPGYHERRSRGPLDGDDEPELLDPPIPKNKRRARIYAKTNGYCFYCTTAWAAHLDHMRPKIRGGTDHDDNMIGACGSCNTRKNDRTVEEYRFYLQHKHRVDPNYRVIFYGEKGRMQ